LRPIPALSDRSKTIRSLVGLPYGVPPRGENCWTFTQRVQREVFGRELPDIEMESDAIAYLVKLINNHAAHDQWKRVGVPIDGGLVEMSCARLPHHVGTYIDLDGGGVLHCDIGSGSSFASLSVLKIIGFQRFIFYDWQG
jgi:cell wall-associated NlpC family hydrolase